MPRERRGWLVNLGGGLISGVVGILLPLLLASVPFFNSLIQELDQPNPQISLRRAWLDYEASFGIGGLWGFFLIWFIVLSFPCFWYGILVTWRTRYACTGEAGLAKIALTTATWWLPPVMLFLIWLAPKGSPLEAYLLLAAFWVAQAIATALYVRIFHEKGPGPNSESASDVSTSSKQSMKCPACGRELTELTVGAVSLDACIGGCAGMWLDKNELRKIDAAEGRAGESLLDIARDPNLKLDPAAKRKCPRCEGVVLRRHFYSVKRDAEVDECPQCNGIWLEAGALATIRQTFKTAAERREATDAFLNNIFTKLKPPPPEEHEK